MSEKISLTVGQLRAGRALCGWSQSDLAKEAGVGVVTVRRIETAESLDDLDVRRDGTLKKLVEALEADGVTFLSGDEPGGPGVRRRKYGRYGS